jgi:diacylglycerol kinase
MANTQNMQQLGDKFKAFSQSLQNIVAAINNDANVRRKQLQAQIAAQ